MSWVTIIWSMAGSACLTLALVHWGIWIKHRQQYAHLVFAVAAVAGAGIGACELLMMRTWSIEGFGTLLRWAHVPVTTAVIAIVGFVWLHFRTGRPWLAYSVCALRGLALLLNFVSAPNLNFSEITGLRRTNFLGEIVATPEGLVNPWTRVGQISSLLLLIYVVDASIALWRKGNRRRAGIVGGSIAFFTLAASVQSALVMQGILQIPFLVSLPFLAILVAMGYELSSEVVRAAQITHQLQISEAELHESEQRMALAADAAGVGLWTWDIERDEVWITDKGRSTFGFAESERVNLDRFISTLHPEDRDRIRQTVDEALKGKKVFESEYRISVPDGEARWISARGRVEDDASGKSILLRGVSLDITDLKRAEERLRLVVEAAPNAMIMFDRAGRITLVNEQAEAVFGYDRRELLGGSMEMLVPEQSRVAHPDLHTGFLANPAPRMMGGGRDLHGRRRDGLEFPIEVRLNPLHTAEGPAVMASIIDLTDRRRAELEAQRHRNELAHLSRVAMLGELSSTLAHELNQPLAAILSNAQAARRFLLAGSPDLRELLAILEDIIRDDKRAGEVIHRLRAMACKEPVPEDKICLNDTVNEVARVLRGEIAAARVNLELELAENLPWVLAGRVEVQQVVMNLVMNALQSMKDTTNPRRTIHVRTEQSDAKTVCISFRDHGCGIPPELFSRVFEPFVTSRPGGLGMGLAICRRLLDAFGGRIQGHNHEQGGAVFSFTLPIASKNGSEKHG